MPAFFKKRQLITDLFDRPTSLADGEKNSSCFCFFLKKKVGVQRAEARGALRVEAAGHSRVGKGRRWGGTCVLANAARSHRVRRAATFATLSVYPPLAAVLRVEAAGHVRIGKGSPQPSGAEGGNVRYAPRLPSAGCGGSRRTGACGHTELDGITRAKVLRSKLFVVQRTTQPGVPQPPSCSELEKV